MFLAIAAVLISAAEPQALDPDLACIVDRVPASARAVILTETASEADGPARAALIEAATACQSERNWTTEQTVNVGMIATAFILGEEAGNLLDKAGIPVGLIDAWFDTQPRDVQTMGRMDDAVGEQVVHHLAGGGVSLSSIEANATQIGFYVGARMMIERIAAGLGPLE